MPSIRGPPGAGQQHARGRGQMSRARVGRVRRRGGTMGGAGARCAARRRVMEGCAVPRYMVASFPHEGVSARAVFLDDEAPRTCAAMWDALPAAGDGMHGSYSGTVVGLFIDPTIVVPEENATSCIQTGDVLFTH